MKTLFIRTAAALFALTCALAPIAPAVADAVGGPKHAHDVAGARSIDTYHIRFYGDEQAIVAAAGEGDIDIKVYDEDGDLVAEDTDYDSTPVCSWTPDYTQTYTIKVINNEYHAVEYALRTN